MQSHFGEWAHLDQASAILDSISKEACGETKNRPTVNQNGGKSTRSSYIREHLENTCTTGYEINVS